MSTKENKNIPTLHIMVGLSASGKSSTVEELLRSEFATVVSSDQIREEIAGSVENQEKNEEVFKEFHKRIRRALESGSNVIADATNLTMKSRRAIMRAVHGLNVNKIAHVIVKDAEQCIADNPKREHPVSEEVIRKQVRRFQMPFYEEGFDKITLDFKTPPNSVHFHNMLRNMNNFDQKNPYHTENLGNHCTTAFKSFERFGYGQGYNAGALLHDIGKLFTQTFDGEGVAHYYDHPNIGAYYLLCQSHLNKICEWRFSHDELLNFLFLVNYHMMPFNWQNEKTHEKYRSIFGPEKYQMLLDFNECDKIRTADNAREQPVELQEKN